MSKIFPFQGKMTQTEICAQSSSLAKNLCKAIVLEEGGTEGYCAKLLLVNIHWLKAKPEHFV